VRKLLIPRICNFLILLAMHWVTNCLLSLFYAEKISLGEFPKGVVKPGPGKGPGPGPEPGEGAGAGEGLVVVTATFI